MAGPLLVAREGQDGPFLHFLGDLGLQDFLRRYPLRRLVEWGWVVPTNRLTFSKEFVLWWHDRRSEAHEMPPAFRHEAVLWDSDWRIDSGEPLWFLSDFFRPGNEFRQYLEQQGRYTRGEPLPASSYRPNGVEVIPYADYFFHWQAYALIDVIRFADCITPLLNTPDVETKAARMVEIARRVKESNPADVLTAEKRWGGLAEPMTWLSHYRALRDAVDSRAFDDSEARELRDRGARELAAHFEITADAFSSFIKDRLLVLVQKWRWANERYCVWTMRAWPYLQRDVLLAVDWLCRITNRTLDSYLDEWRYKHLGQEQWAQLKDVLPFEFFTDRATFLELAPTYLKDYNASLPAAEQFTGTRLRDVVDRLRSANYPFGSFLSAFRQLHEEMTYRREHRVSIDFRDRRPLDYYSLLAIRAEGVLRWKLKQDGMLKTQSLSGYIRQLAESAGVTPRWLQQFKTLEPKLTKLHDEREHPIHDIMSLNPGLGPREDRLLQACLCSVLARNYFAHHHYLDAELTRSTESAFMLGGILFTVLFA